MSDPDIALKVIVKNARILRAMRDCGITSLLQLAKLAPEANYGVMLTITALKRKPINRHGEWLPTALAMADALNVEPEDLWPEHIINIALKSNTVAFDVTLDQFASIAGGEERVLQLDQIRHFMARLPRRHCTVIEMRFGLNGNGVHTLEEVGQHLGVTRERIRAIENQALRKMMQARHGAMR